MTKAEANKIAAKYDFLIDHNFEVNGENLYVAEITTEEGCDHQDCEVYIFLKHTDGREHKETLANFLTKVGATFWIKYFNHLKN